mmetsp:Transcript_57659/g.172026  ORF Transcript_57659/g.172026 Transcript_57659/m.172026 type:complete len:247 (-) Transcript_57659:53-793(-)
MDVMGLGHFLLSGSLTVEERYQNQHGNSTPYTAVAASGKMFQMMGARQHQLRQSLNQPILVLPPLLTKMHQSQLLLLPQHPARPRSMSLLRMKMTVILQPLTTFPRMEHRRNRRKSITFLLGWWYFVLLEGHTGIINVRLTSILFGIDQQGTGERAVVWGWEWVLVWEGMAQECTAMLMLIWARHLLSLQLYLQRLHQPDFFVFVGTVLLRVALCWVPLQETSYCCAGREIYVVLAVIIVRARQSR